MRFQWLFVFLMFLLPMSMSAQEALEDSTSNNGITLVSDTTDDVVQDSDDVVSDAIPTMPDFGGQWKFISDIFNGDILPSIIGLPMILIGIFALLFLLFPFILVIILLWIIFRKNKRQSVQNNTQTDPVNAVTVRESTKDSAVRNISIGIGLIVFCMIMGWKLGTAIGALLAIYGIGQYIIARRNGEQ